MSCFCRGPVRWFPLRLDGSLPPSLHSVQRCYLPRRLSTTPIEQAIIEKVRKSEKELRKLKKTRHDQGKTVTQAHKTAHTDPSQASQKPYELKTKPAASKSQSPAPTTVTAPRPSKDKPLALYAYSQRTPYAQILLRNPHPTVLYTAPSHLFFSIATHFQAIFCYVYAGYNFNAMYLHPPSGVAAWVPPAFGGICVLMAGFGTWLALGPRRLIGKITAVPGRLADGRESKGREAEAATTLAEKQQPGSAEELLIEIELKRLLPLPFVKPRIISVKPEHITLAHKVGKPDLGRQLKAGDLRAIEFVREYEEKRKRDEAAPWWKKPFRRFSQATFEIAQSFGRVWTRKGFVDVGVKGKWLALKMDIKDGEMVERGHGLDRLFNVKKRI